MTQNNNKTDILRLVGQGRLFSLDRARGNRQVEVHTGTGMNLPLGVVGPGTMYIPSSGANLI